MSQPPRLAELELRRPVATRTAIEAHEARRAEAVEGEEEEDQAFLVLKLRLPEPKKGAEASGGRELLLTALEVAGRAAAELSGEDLLRLLGSGVEGERAHLITELPAGISLTTLLSPSEGAPLGAEEAAALCLDLARALRVAHSRVPALPLGWLHPDLIFVDEEGRAKLVNAFPWRPLFEALFQEVEPPAGLSEHRAPEQRPHRKGAQGQNKIEVIPDKSDIYLLGSLFFRIICGQRTEELAGEDGVPPPVEALLPDAPEELASLVNRMLSVEAPFRPILPEVVATLTPLVASASEVRTSLGARVDGALRRARAALPPGEAAATQLLALPEEAAPSLDLGVGSYDRTVALALPEASGSAPLSSPGLASSGLSDPSLDGGIGEVTQDSEAPTLDEVDPKSLGFGSEDTTQPVDLPEAPVSIPSIRTDAIVAAGGRRASGAQPVHAPGGAHPLASDDGEATLPAGGAAALLSPAHAPPAGERSPGGSFATRSESEASASIGSGKEPMELPPWALAAFGVGLLLLLLIMVAVILAATA